MATLREAHRSGGLIDSLEDVGFDAGRGVYRATYDGGSEPASLAVVSVVAAARDVSLTDLSPLQRRIDTDSLDSLCSPRIDSPGCCNTVSFRYEGFDVTVFGEGSIEAEPVATE